MHEVRGERREKKKVIKKTNNKIIIDPLGSRIFAIENELLNQEKKNSDPNPENPESDKNSCRMLFILNKIDLVPLEVFHYYYYYYHIFINKTRCPNPGSTCCPKSSRHFLILINSVDERAKTKSYFNCLPALVRTTRKNKKKRIKPL